MKPRKIAIGAGLLIAVLALCAAIYFAFASKLTTGKMYPVHSSLRADPRGTMLLYEALGPLSDVSSSRSYEPMQDWMRKRTAAPSETTVLLLDGRWQDVTDDAWFDFVLQGGRLVVSLPASDLILDNEHDSSSSKSEASPSPQQEQLDENSPQPASADNGVTDSDHSPPSGQLHASPLSILSMVSTQRRRVATPVSLALNPDAGVLAEHAPASPIWYSREVLTLIPDDTDERSNDKTTANTPVDDSGQATADQYWETIYSNGNQPVIVGQKIGRGEVIILANGLPLTNERVLKRDELEFITWILGERANIVFDEYHFGITQPHGIASLIHDYGLASACLALTVTFILFIWHSASPLMPTVPTPRAARPLSHTAVSAYRDLLSRHIPTAQLLRECLSQWRQAFMSQERERLRHDKNYQQALELVNEEQLKPVRKRQLGVTYHKISNLLNPRRKRP